MAQNAKIRFDKRRGTYSVELWWTGQRYWRGHYDHRMNTMKHIDLAKRVQEHINAEIDIQGPAFDPRQHFRASGFEYQFDHYASEWILKNRDRYAPSARQQTARYIQMAIDFFGDRDIRAIRKADVRRYLEEGIPAEWAPKTKRDGVLSVLHKILSDAFDDELIQRLPGWPKVQVIEAEVKWIDRETQDRIIEAIPERDRPIFYFMREYGVRPGEARALQWEDVDFEKESITIKRTFSGAGCNYPQSYTKTKRVRYLPFTNQIRSTLKRVRGIGGFVFRNTAGRPYTSDLSRIWNNARSKAGAPSVTLYQGTRHSFATQHLDNLDVVRQVLGHTSPSMTMKYQGINTSKILAMINSKPTAKGS